MRIPTTVPAVALLATIIFVGTACTQQRDTSADSSTNSTQPPMRTQHAPLGDSSGSGLPDFTRLVAQYGDAVVNVEVIQRPTRASRFRSPEDPLAEFFHRFGAPAPEFGPREEQPPARGAGSGFIVSRDGHVLTNAHVVADAEEVTVRLTDRREFTAKVIGSDARSDVALIKIDAQDLPTVNIGDPSRLQTGQWVLAIGSPFGLESTATAGIVSATSRSVGPESYVPFIQTDVAVNPGNSGGPLFNLQGEVIGINSMIFSRTGGYMGVSFAVPIDVAIEVRDQLQKTGRVVRGRIGVAVQDVTAQLSSAFGMGRPRGALVSYVEDGGPAAKAGVQPGDVILAVGPQEVNRFSELAALVARMAPSTRTTLRVWRDGKEHDLGIRIGELEEKEAAVSADTAAGADRATSTLGMAVRPLTPQERSQTGTSGSVVVEDVTGAAAAAGLQPGDIVLGVNGRRITTVDALRDAVKEGRETVALLIQRGDAQIFVPIRAG